MATLRLLSTVLPMSAAMSEYHLAERDGEERLEPTVKASLNLVLLLLGGTEVHSTLVRELQLPVVLDSLAIGPIVQLSRRTSPGERVDSSVSLRGALFEDVAAFFTPLGVALLEGASFYRGSTGHFGVWCGRGGQSYRDSLNCLFIYGGGWDLRHVFSSTNLLRVGVFTFFTTLGLPLFVLEVNFRSFRLFGSKVMFGFNLTWSFIFNGVDIIPGS